jgi:hypothetical protein
MSDMPCQVCFCIYSGHLIRNFVYRAPSIFHGLMHCLAQLTIYFIAKDVHSALGVSRNFFWTSLNLWAEQVLHTFHTLSIHFWSTPTILTVDPHSGSSLTRDPHSLGILTHSGSSLQILTQSGSSLWIFTHSGSFTLDSWSSI